MTSLASSVASLFDNTYFRIFFAAWTGFYLWQVIKGEEGEQFMDFTWMIIGFLVAMFFLGNKVTEG